MNITRVCGLSPFGALKVLFMCMATTRPSKLDIETDSPSKRSHLGDSPRTPTSVVKRSHLDGSPRTRTSVVKRDHLGDSPRTPTSVVKRSHIGDSPRTPIYFSCETCSPW